MGVGYITSSCPTAIPQESELIVPIMPVVAKFIVVIEDEAMVLMYRFKQEFKSVIEAS